MADQMERREGDSPERSGYDMAKGDERGNVTYFCSHCFAVWDADEPHDPGCPNAVDQPAGVRE